MTTATASSLGATVYGCGPSTAARISPVPLRSSTRLLGSSFRGCRIAVGGTSASANHGGAAAARNLRVAAELDLTGSHMYDDFNDSDEEFVNASLLPAVEVKSGSEGFLVKMADGSMLRCVHNTSEGTRLPDYSPQPAMVLKLEDSSNILLPLIVLEQPRTTLLEAMKQLPLARPTIYLVVRDMIELMGYELKLVRITHRVCEAYYARAFLSKVGDDSGAIMSLDLRPSDAINLAVRAKVPIQVNKALAVGDGVRQVSMVPRVAARGSIRALRSYHFTWTDADRPDTSDATVNEEFAMVQLMEQAAREERFADAAKLRDQLRLFRESKTKQA